jgi:hypothetical protein
MPALGTFGTPPRRREGPADRLRPDGHDGSTPRRLGDLWARRLHGAAQRNTPRRWEGCDAGGASTSPAGAPTRRRGGPGRAGRASGVLRNTPASVGTTTRAPGLAAPFHGAPPRRRGGLKGASDRLDISRNTPASAGRTLNGHLDDPGEAEHPRVGGEDVRDFGTPGFCVGTPPRRRGGPGLASPLGCAHRNTPASAMRTPSRRPCRSRSTKRPRVGGDDWHRSPAIGTCSGTPPRRRGGRLRPRHHHRHRNTPASAGKTCTPTDLSAATAEHPRAGGEDSPDNCPTCRGIGTLPRWRGRQVQPRRRRRAGRSTPASAGKTAEGNTVKRDPPRSTPASAGKTSPRPRSRPCPPEHPRVGREDRAGRSSHPVRVGAPPRRRGRPA